MKFTKDNFQGWKSLEIFGFTFTLISGKYGYKPKSFPTSKEFRLDFGMNKGINSFVLGYASKDALWTKLFVRGFKIWKWKFISEYIAVHYGDIVETRPQGPLGIAKEYFKYEGILGCHIYK